MMKKIVNIRDLVKTNYVNNKITILIKLLNIHETVIGEITQSCTLISLNFYIF